MLTPEYLEHLPDRLVELYADVEIDILRDMVRRISAFDDFIPSAQWQFKKLQEMGRCREYIVERLSQLTGETRQHIIDLMTKAGMETLEFDDEIYRAAGLDPKPLEASPGLREALAEGLQSTMGLFSNLTHTTANTASGQFERALDRAWLQIQSGAFSVQQAITQVVKDLSKSGVGARYYPPSIRYPSGHIDKLDVAVRRAVLTGVNQTALKLQEARMDEMGCELVEVSAHAGARVGNGLESPSNHAWWQGKVYRRAGSGGDYPDFEESTGYGTGEGLGGWNCRHSFFPYYEGVSRPAYTQKELEELNAPMYLYNGTKLTEAEAVSRQRAFERTIRRWKREKAAMEAAGLGGQFVADKLKKVRAAYQDFLEQTGLKRDYGREQVKDVRSERLTHQTKESTINFKNSELFTEHYEKHRGEFGDISKEEYVKRAKDFLAQDLSDDVVQLIRSDGSIARYKFSTNEFAAVTADRVIKTYFLPKTKGAYWEDEKRRNP